MLATVHRAAQPWQGLDDVPLGWGPCVITIGVFDGVHRGHARLIGRTVQRARDHRLPALLITFDPHPARMTGPPRNTATLSTPQRRAELAQQLGVDAVLVLPFTTALAHTTATEFVTRVLVDRLRARALIVGENFRFGAGGDGDLDTLRDLGRQHGFTAEGVELLHTTVTRYSSTHIRTCLATGDVTAAAEALGRPHRVEGRLAGNTLEVPAGTALPADGHYQGLLATAGGDPQPIEVTVDSQRTLMLHGTSLRAGNQRAVLDFLPSIPTRADCRGTLPR